MRGTEHIIKCLCVLQASDMRQEHSSKYLKIFDHFYVTIFLIGEWQKWECVTFSRQDIFNGLSVSGVSVTFSPSEIGF